MGGVGVVTRQDRASISAGRAANAIERALGPVGIVSLAAGALVLIVIAAASVLLAARNAENRAALDQAQDVQIAIGRLLVSAQDAETGQRGFLLTGKESYLEPYYRAITLLPSELDALERMLPQQAGTVAELAQAVMGKIDELRQTVELGRTRQMAGALGIVQSDRGKALMDTIRALIDRLDSQVRESLRSLDRRSELDSILLLVTDCAGALLIMALAATTALQVRRNLRALGTARAALRESNAKLAAANAVLAGTNQALEERVRIRTADLVEANEEIQRFAYIVSHDLRAPLVNIMGFTSELEAASRHLGQWVLQSPTAPRAVSDAAREDLPEAIGFIKASTGKMDRLIRAILSLSREGRRTLAPQGLDMHALLSGVLDSVRFQTGQQGGEVSLGAVPDLVADKVAVEQVFSNVIENALKYRAPDRPVRVAVSGRPDGGTVVYEIADNGRGIAARDRERVFELFRRAGDQSVPGEGIGLAHVRALLRRMGGSIDFDSQLGRGTVFRITLPALKAPADGGQMETAA